MPFNVIPQVVNLAKKIVNPIRPTSRLIATTTKPSDITKNTTGKILDDLRVKISLPPESPSIFYLDKNNTLMEMLYKTNGFLFPIQPDITVSHSAEYQSIKPTHSNFPYYHYTNSEIQQISITAEFPIRTDFDARYVNSGIHFLRSCTRMFNGKDGILAGAPPIVVRLKGLGFSGFDNIPVVITNVNVTYPSSVDAITFRPFIGATETAKISSLVTIQISMNPVFSRDFITNQYSTLKYSTAALGLLGQDRPFNDKGEPVSRKSDSTLPAIDPPPTPDEYFNQITEQGNTVIEPAPAQQPGVETSGPRSVSN